MTTADKANTAERRRTKRRPILDTFSIFAVVQQKGPYRLPIHDLSDQGLGMDLDIEGEDGGLAVQPGDVLHIHLYLNQSLYVPVEVRAANVETRGTVRRIGAEFTAKDTPGYRALAAFVAMLDELAKLS